jgi:hypothetical protein
MTSKLEQMTEAEEIAKLIQTELRARALRAAEGRQRSSEDRSWIDSQVELASQLVKR